MDHNVLCGIIVKICEARYFGLMADKTRDISNKEQLAIGLTSAITSMEIH